MNEAVSDIERNTCASSYVAAYNSRHMASLIETLYVNERIETDLSKKYLIYSKNKIVHCLSNYPKHVIIFLILQTFNHLPQLNRKRWIGHIASEIL
jgi:hypothetical protein